MGAFYTLAIKADGTLWGWGASGNGQLGDGAPTGSVAHPKQIGTATNWKTVTATDEQHNVSGFGTRTDGTLWAWGDNAFGQLGDGSKTTRLTPVRVGTATNWSAVAYGAGRHTVALQTDGTLWAWGTGELGDGSTSTSTTPVHIGTATNWTLVAAGQMDTLAVRSDGTLWAWGYDWVPDSPPGTPLLLPQWRTAPGPVSSTTRWATVVTEFRDVLAVGTDGSLWGWGYNAEGELGDDTITTRPTPEQIGTATDWSSVAGSAASGSYGIQTNGTLWSWGNNSDEQLGRSGDPFAPGQVGTDSDWVSVAGGQMHAVGLKSDGTLWAWGNGLDGQLGNGVPNFAGAPEQVGTATDWSTIAASDNFALAIKTDGTLWAWGDNSNGQLGSGSVGGTQLSPQQVGTDTHWAKIQARNNHVVSVEGRRVTLGLGRRLAWSSRRRRQRQRSIDARAHRHGDRLVRALGRIHAHPRAQTGRDTLGLGRQHQRRAR